MESALYGIYALIFVSEIERVSAEYVNTVQGTFHEVFYIYIEQCHWCCVFSFFSFRSADCPAGSYSTLNRTCILCPRGTYQPERGRPSCISCGQNLTTPSNGTADKLLCISKSNICYSIKLKSFCFSKSIFSIELMITNNIWRRWKYLTPVLCNRPVLKKAKVACMRSVGGRKQKH